MHFSTLDGEKLVSISYFLFVYELIAIKRGFIKKVHCISDEVEIRYSASLYRVCLSSSNERYWLSQVITCSELTWSGRGIQISDQVLANRHRFQWLIYNRFSLTALSWALKSIAHSCSILRCCSSNHKSKRWKEVIHIQTLFG